MKTSETLSSLAMLKVNADTQGLDYLDYVVPFVSYTLDRHRPARITDSALQGLLLEEFGLNIPSQTAELVLRRLAKRRLLMRDHHEYRISGPIPVGKIEERRAAAKQKQAVVINHLQEFAAKHHGVTWSEQEATEALLAYLARFSIECLRTFAHGAALPDIPERAEKDLNLVGLFIKRAYEYSPEVFECVVVFVKGHMLSNALLCSDLDSLDRKFSKVTFYIDTPLMMWLFKLWGHYRYAAATELLDQLRTLKAVIAVFDHTVSEIRRVLQACELNIDNPKAANWRMIVAMREAGIQKSDISFLRASLARTFETLGIVQQDTPAYISQFQIDENLLHKALDEDIHYFNPKAEQDDVNSVRSIYALRKGTRPLHLEDSVAVLVTTNAKLAETVYQFGQQHEASREVSPVITEFSLANIAWLKAPMRAPELPRFELMADCYAALEPSQPLWSKYLAEIDRLRTRGNISADEHEMLRSSLIARDELMHLTLGSEEALTERTLSQIVDRVKADLVKEKNVEIATERKSHAATEAERIRLLRQDEAVRKRIFHFAEQFGAILAKTLIGILVLVLLASSVFSAFWAQSLMFDSWFLTFGAIALVIVGIVWGVVSGFSGMSFNELAKNIERKSQASLYRLLMRCFYPEEKTPSPPLAAEPATGNSAESQ